MNRCSIAVVCLALFAVLFDFAESAEIVIQNDSDRPFYFSIRDQSRRAWGDSQIIEPHESHKIETNRPQQISYLSDRAHFVRLSPGRTYRIMDVRRGQLRAVGGSRRSAARPATSGTRSGTSNPRSDGSDRIRQRSLPGDSPYSADRPAPANPRDSEPTVPGREPADVPPSIDPSVNPFERYFGGSDTESGVPRSTDPPTASDPSGTESSSPRALPAPATVPPAVAPPTAAPPSTGDAVSGPPSTVEPSVKRSEASGTATDSVRGVEARRPVRWSGDDIREVHVLALVDDTYRMVIRDWRDRVPSIVGGVSDYYEREFGIRLVLDKVARWDYTALTDKPADRWNALVRQAPGDSELVIAFAGFGDFYKAQPETTYTGQLGRAAFFGQHVLIADQHDIHENRPKTTLIHELGHVFGAFHIDDPSLVMNPSYADLPASDIISGRVAFGEPLREIVLQTRTFDFRRGVEGLAPELRKQIQRSFRRYGRPAEHDETDPVTSGFEYLRERAENKARDLDQKAQQSRTDFLTVSR